MKNIFRSCYSLSCTSRQFHLGRTGTHSNTLSFSCDCVFNEVVTNCIFTVTKLHFLNNRYFLLQVLAPQCNQETTSESDKFVRSDESEVLSEDKIEEVKNLLSSAGFHLINGNNPSQPLAIPKEEVPLNAAKLAGFLIDLRCNLDDSFKEKHQLPPYKFSTSNEERQDVTVGDESSPSAFALRKIKVLQHATIDLLLDIMVKFCPTPERRSHEDSSDLRSDPSPDGHKAVNKSESNVAHGGSHGVQFLIYGRGTKADESTCIRSMQFMGVNGTDTSKRETPVNHIFPPEISAGALLDLDSIQECQVLCYKFLE